jgi:hypothetical protein
MPMKVAAAVRIPITASDSHGAKVWVTSAATDPAAHASKGAQRIWAGAAPVPEMVGA